NHLKWVIDRLSLELPSSRDGYAPSFGLRLDAPEENISISVTVTLKCKCLPAGSSEVDDAYSIGVGITKHFWGGGVRKKRHCSMRQLRTDFKNDPHPIINHAPPRTY